MSFNKFFKACKVNPVTAAIARIVGRKLCRHTEAFIFVANTGRCGSTSLTEIFSSIPNAASFHEPYPNMSGRSLIDYNNGSAAYRDKVFFERKIPRIYWSARRSKLYFESNHLFIKCFADLAVAEFGDKMKVIYLHRDKLEVACSMYNRRDIDEMTNFALSPFASENLLKIDSILIDNSNFDSLFYHALWYCYEIEARTSAFAIKNPQIPIVELRTQDLNSYEKILRSLSNLGIGEPKSLLKKVGIRANANKRASTLPEGIQTADVVRFQSICEVLLADSGLKWNVKAKTA